MSKGNKLALCFSAIIVLGALYCAAFDNPSSAPAAGAQAAEIPVVTEPDAPEPVRIAGRELAGYLQRIYPNAAGKTVRLVSNLPTPESYAITATESDALIAGGGARGVVYGVYALLQKLGCGFYLWGDVVPAERTGALSFKDWTLADQPLVGERIVFNWHNFLSGCSTWNLPDWKRWTAQSQKLGYNAIMVHAYGNNPMASFDFEGVHKPVGFLSTTMRGRDWSTMHVNDVRRLWGGAVFDQPVFGADAGLVPDRERAAAAQALMREVFADAVARGMGVYFAVDVDTPSANPQELILRLPESARFKSLGGLWLPNPDTTEGYAYYRAQVGGLLKAYPQITTLVAWFRRDETPWSGLKAGDLPPAWQEEFAAEIARTPEAASYWHGPGLFGIGKILRAFDRALKELGASKTGLAAGTWEFRFLPAGDRFFPAGVTVIGLDYAVLRLDSDINKAASRSAWRQASTQRPVIPVIWAHHDDGAYLGRPYTPFAEFHSKLADAHAAGFGVIHWTTRPLDLYFASHSRQVWQSTRDEPLRATCDHVAARMLGDPKYGEYLHRWVTQAPSFARETSDFFIDRKLTDIAGVRAGCRQRSALLDTADTGQARYFHGLEQFMAAFYETQDLFQRSQAALKSNDLHQARQLMAQCSPGPVVEQFAKFSSIGGITRGEQGLVVSMNLRWLSHLLRHRQALGLEPVRIKFGPTQHDPLAQSPGAFTFHFTPGRDVWECWGEKETGARVFTVPEAADELARTGIEIERSLTLGLRPIMGKSGSLLPGAYHLRLLVNAPLVCDLEVAGNRHHADLAQRAGLVELKYSVTLAAAGTCPVTIIPTSGKARLRGAILEPEKP